MTYCGGVVLAAIMLWPQGGEQQRRAAARAAQQHRLLHVDPGLVQDTVRDDRIRASMAKRSAAPAAATTSRVAAGVTVNDFSTRMALPAAGAARASARWWGCGVAT